MLPNLIPSQSGSAPSKPEEPPVMRQETDEDFVTRVKPRLSEIETVRRVKYKTYCRRRKIGSLMFLAAAPFTGFIDYIMMFTDRFFSHGDKHGGGLTALLIGAIYYWVTAPKRQYVSFYKNEILPRIARLLGLNSYLENGKIDAAEMQPSKIFPRFDRYHSEDYFEGVYKGAHVKFAQAKLEQERGSGKNRHYVTVFAGLVLLVQMPRNKFHGTTVMLRNHGGLFEWFEEKGLGLEKADLVDPVFERKYTVYTSDQVEARYLLDPMMIERVQNLAVIYNAGDVKLSYYHDKVLALLSCSRNLFEPPDISIPATDVDGMLDLKHEVEKTLELIDCVDSFLSRTGNAPAAGM
jgi:hypothetical protein